ncbi:MAG: hypothetical protein ACP6KW_09470 [Candidatus Thorarchaeota archaeon]
MQALTRARSVLGLGVINHIASLLDSIGIKYSINEQEKIIRMDWKTDRFDSLRVKIVASDNESWVYIVAILWNFYEVAESSRMKLAYDMLKESWRTNGVKFAINEEDDMIVIAETNDTDLTADEIRTLVGHVVLACDSMWELHNAAR